MLLSCVIQIDEGWWKEQHWLECVRSDYNGEPQHGAGAVVHHQMLGDHLQVHDVLSGARERLCEHQHGARIAGTLQENEPINKNWIDSQLHLSIPAETQWNSDLYGPI